jgi:hypothetical protein
MSRGPDPKQDGVARAEQLFQQLRACAALRPLPRELVRRAEAALGRAVAGLHARTPLRLHQLHRTESGAARWQLRGARLSGAARRGHQGHQQGGLLARLGPAAGHGLAALESR